MTSPVDALLERLGLQRIVPAITEPVSFTVIVRSQGRRPGSLIKALGAIAAQTNQSYDVIVVVHAGAASAAEVEASLQEAQGLPRKLQILALQGGGRSRPLNLGLDNARGDYVCFLDDDDLVTEDWLAAFSRAASAAEGRLIRAVTQVQNWTTEGSAEPLKPAGSIEYPFAPSFDLLAHFSHNETPICSIALPRAALDRLGLRFDEDLPVLEDWDLLMRSAMLIGVYSIPEATSLYRRLDAANAFSAVSETQWRHTHNRVIEGLATQPLVLPGSAARKLADAGFVAATDPSTGCTVASQPATAIRRTLGRLGGCLPGWLAGWLRGLLGGLPKRRLRRDPAAAAAK